MPAAASTLAHVPLVGESPAPLPAPLRFTLDGDATLESHLARICERVRQGVERLIPAGRLEGILLGGGYGRGEGGVLRTASGDQPYNDLEFYVLLRGSTLLNERRHGRALGELAHDLGSAAGIEVEFKVLSTAWLRRLPVSMFSYDLVQGHRRVCGDEALLRGCAHHRQAAAIPPAEATRLLFNRCSGLLFARARLDRLPFAAADADYAERNVAKARLALGDVVLTVCHEYHWSCRERARRLLALPAPEGLACLPALREEHVRGVDFKLHPHRSRRSAADLREDLWRISLLACQVWFWLEHRRLGVAFRHPSEYALHPANKCPETSSLRNWLVNARRFGWRELAGRRAFRYPRERLLRALPVLLWRPVMLGNPQVRASLQRDLRTTAVDQPGLLAAYTRLWEGFR